MELINIAVGNKDGAHKILEIRTNIEGCGRHTITRISNMVEVAQSLGRPVFYTMKHLMIEMQAVIRSGGKEGTFEIVGAHTAKELAQAVNKFIKTYVECYSCGHPQTKLVVNEKSKAVNLVCDDCGSISEVESTQVTLLMVRFHFLGPNPMLKRSKVWSLV